MKLSMKVAALLLATLGGQLAFAQKLTDEQRMTAIEWAMHRRIKATSDLFYTDGDYPRSVQILRVQSAIWPQDYDTVADLGLLLESTDQKSEALARYISYRKNNAAQPDAPLLEAFFYFKNKLYAKMPPLLEPVIRRKPHPNVYRQLATAYERLELYADSKRVLEKFLADYPRDETVVTAKKNLDRVEKKLKGEGTPAAE